MQIAYALVLISMCTCPACRPACIASITIPYPLLTTPVHLHYCTNSTSLAIYYSFTFLLSTPYCSPPNSSPLAHLLYYYINSLHIYINIFTHLDILYIHIYTHYIHIYIFIYICIFLYIIIFIFIHIYTFTCL